MKLSHFSRALQGGGALAVGLALALTTSHAVAQTSTVGAAANAAEPTISKNELRRALYPNDPDNPNSATDPSNPTGNNVPNANGESIDMRYRWSYSRADPRTGLPLELPHEDERRAQIDEFRVDCLKLISDMDAANGGSTQIPRSQFDNLEDQWSVMILGCVNKLHIARAKGMKGIGAIMCEAHTGECWGPDNVWSQKPNSIVH